jgi:K+-transporting ATPase KdpF subunit
LLVLRPSLRKTLTTQPEDPMDYLIASAAALLLFVYLIYALLKPERF